MKTSAVLVLCFAAYVIAAPTSKIILKLPALQHEQTHDELGQYSLRYVTADNTVVYEKGWLVPNPDGDGQVMVSEGEVSYVGDDGKVYSTKYTAGFDGYNPVGAHLEVAPLEPVVAPAPILAEMVVAPAPAEVLINPESASAEVVVVAV